MRVEPNKDLEVEAESGGEGAGRAGMAEGLGIASWDEVEKLSRTRLQRVLDRVRLWHLAAVLGVGLAGYLAVRGSDDYDAYKRWKARGLAVQGIQQARAGDDEGARELLDLAAVLVPGDPEVMRKVVDFGLPRRDPAALVGLRGLLGRGAVADEDWERAARLAIEWGRLELAPSRLLLEWSTQPVAEVPLARIRLSCRWLALRGERVVAERRLREVLGMGVRDAESELMLCALLLRPEGSNAGRVREAMERLSAVASEDSVAFESRSDAMKMEVRAYLEGPARPMLTPEVESRLLRELDVLVENALPEAVRPLQLLRGTVEVATDPSRRRGVLMKLEGDIEKKSGAVKLEYAVWLVGVQAFEEALAYCERNVEQAASAEWFAVRLDALAGLKRYEAAVAALDAEGQPLTEWRRRLLQYRLGMMAGEEAAGMGERRKRLEVAMGGVEPREVLEAAGMLEVSGDPEFARELYGRVADDNRFGLYARMAIVRYYEGKLDRTEELKAALEAVLESWPAMEDARNDLMYLRLVDGTAGESDLRGVREAMERAPELLANRVTAALAELLEGNAGRARECLAEYPVNWREVNPGWQAVEAAVSAANGEMERARASRVRLMGKPLRAGEQSLLERYVEGRDGAER